VKQCQPKFIALHLQEVGGKTYEKSMEYVQDFIKMLCESEDLQTYTRIRVYLDEDYKSAENFTVSFTCLLAYAERLQLVWRKKKEYLVSK